MPPPALAPLVLLARLPWPSRWPSDKYQYQLDHGRYDLSLVSWVSVFEARSLGCLPALLLVVWKCFSTQRRTKRTGHELMMGASHNIASHWNFWACSRLDGELPGLILGVWNLFIWHNGIGIRSKNEIKMPRALFYNSSVSSWLDVNHAIEWIHTESTTVWLAGIN